MARVETTEMLLNELEELISDGAKLPGFGKRVINEDQALELIEKIREKMPHEINEARHIVADKNKLIRDAEEQKREILRKAEHQAKYLLDHDELVIQAKRKSAEIISEANGKAKDIFNGAKAYSEEMFKTTDDILTGFLTKIRQSKQGIKNMTYTDFQNMPDTKNDK